MSKVYVTVIADGEEIQIETHENATVRDVVKAILRHEGDLTYEEWAESVGDETTSLRVYSEKVTAFQVNSAGQFQIRLTSDLTPWEEEHDGEVEGATRKYNISLNFPIRVYGEPAATLNKIKPEHWRSLFAELLEELYDSAFDEVGDAGDLDFDEDLMFESKGPAEKFTVTVTEVETGKVFTVKED